MPVEILGAVIKQESGFNQQAKSPVGAIGLTQLMPLTAQGLGVNPHDAFENVVGGAIYLKRQIDKFGLRAGIAAYNSGPGAVEKYHRQVPPYPETQQYVNAIMATLAPYGIK